MKIPKSLRTWFLIHFIVDVIFAIPLLFFPEWTLGLFGLKTIETVTPRLVGAALIGIGGTSYFTKEKDFSIMLTLKILWSLSAILGLLLAIYSGAPSLVWVIAGIFALFSGIWIYYKISNFKYH